MTDYPFADVALARRLERTEGAANRAFVEARARTHPEVGACWIEEAGALAMFDGPASPLTQICAMGYESTNIYVASQAAGGFVLAYGWEDNL